MYHKEVVENDFKRERICIFQNHYLAVKQPEIFPHKSKEKIESFGLQWSLTLLFIFIIEILDFHINI